MHIWDATQQVFNEASDAIGKFPAFRSPHEGFAIILEELEELKAEVFRNHNIRSVENMRDEAKQVGAMAIRFMTDLT